MRHHLNLHLTPEREREQVVGLKKVGLTRRLVRKLLGDKAKFTIIVPGESVDQVTITQTGDDLTTLAQACGVLKDVQGGEQQ